MYLPKTLVFKGCVCGWSPAVDPQEVKLMTTIGGPLTQSRVFDPRVTGSDGDYRRLWSAVRSEDLED